MISSRALNMSSMPLNSSNTASCNKRSMSDEDQQRVTLTFVSDSSADDCCTANLRRRTSSVRFVYTLRMLFSSSSAFCSVASCSEVST